MSAPVKSATKFKPRYVEVDGRPLRVFYRIEFMTHRFKYKAGQHVAFLAPSQNGKTTLAFQLLMFVLAQMGIRVYVLVMKPRDAVPAAWAAHLGLVEVATWPDEGEPKVKFGHQPPPGYMLWPHHTFKASVDNAHMSVEFAKLLEYAYGTGDCIVFGDEIYGLTAELDGLVDPLIAIWTRGGGMGCGLWGATQKPTGANGKGVPGFMYSNSSHLFIAKDPDKKSRDRYGEIAGVDPQWVAKIVMTLKRHQFLYICEGDANGGPYYCIVDAR